MSAPVVYFEIVVNVVFVPHPIWLIVLFFGRNGPSRNTWGSISLAGFSLAHLSLFRLEGINDRRCVWRNDKFCCLGHLGFLSGSIPSRQSNIHPLAPQTQNRPEHLMQPGNPQRRSSPLSATCRLGTHWNRRMAHSACHRPGLGPFVTLFAPLATDCRLLFGSAGPNSV